MKTIEINVADNVSDDLCQQIRDQALQLGIDRLAQHQQISYPEAAAQMGLSPDEADRLLEGMEWLNDPLIQEELAWRAAESEAELRRGETVATEDWYYKTAWLVSYAEAQGVQWPPPDDLSAKQSPYIDVIGDDVCQAAVDYLDGGYRPRFEEFSAGLKAFAQQNAAGRTLSLLRVIEETAAKDGISFAEAAQRRCPRFFDRLAALREWLNDPAVRSHLHDHDGGVRSLTDEKLTEAR